MFRVSRVVAHFFISLFFVWSKTFRLLFGLLLQKRVCFFLESVGPMNVHDFQGLLGNFWSFEIQARTHCDFTQVRQ